MPGELGHRRVDEAGADRDRAHAVVVEVGVQRVRECEHRRLRRRVDRQDRHRLRSGDRGEVDDPALRRTQVRDRSLRDEHEAAQVDRELAVDVLQLRVLDSARDPDPGRVDEHVETAVALDVLAHEPLAVLRLETSAAIAVAPSSAAAGLDLLGRARGEGELEALLAEHPRDREPDARRASCDQRRRTRFDYLGNAQGVVNRTANLRKITSLAPEHAPRGASETLRRLLLSPERPPARSPRPAQSLGAMLAGMAGHER